jgi:hypothetical protein
VNPTLYAVEFWPNLQDAGQYVYFKLIGPFPSTEARDEFLTARSQHDPWAEDESSYFGLDTIEVVSPEEVDA